MNLRVEKGVQGDLSGFVCFMTCCSLYEETKIGAHMDQSFCYLMKGGVRSLHKRSRPLHRKNGRFWTQKITSKSKYVKAEVTWNASFDIRAIKDDENVCGDIENILF